MLYQQSLQFTSSVKRIWIPLMWIAHFKFCSIAFLITKGADVLLANMIDTWPTVGADLKEYGVFSSV